MCASVRVGRGDRLAFAGRPLAVAETGGSGVPLLICNDFLLSMAVLDDLCTALPQPTLRFDVPGVGASPASRRPLGMTAVAALVAAWLRATGAPVDVLGVGWGGLLAQRLAHDHPGCVRRLLLVATGPGAIAWPGRLACLRQVLTPGGWQSACEDGAAVQALFGGRRADECEAVARALSCSTAPTRRGYATQLFALAGFSSLAWLHRLCLPTLILAGDDDRLLPLANARLLATLIPRAELVVLRGAGHWLLLERLDEACARIESFTAGVREPGAGGC